MTDFLVALTAPDLAQGDTQFSWGNPNGTGLWVGTINNTNGVLTGKNLTFSLQQPGVINGIPGSHFIVATAPTFSVTTGVPEPSTWIMMILGFGAIGYGMRSRRDKKVLSLARG